MTPEDERQKQYTLLWLFIIIAGLLFIYIVANSQYKHPMPAAQCKPYDYAICERAETPPVVQEPPATTVYLSIVAVAIFALSLLVLSYRSSVIGNTPKPRPVSPSIPELPSGKDAWGHPVQSTIYKNEIPKESIRAPAAKPTQGVDPQLIGGKNG